MSNQEKKSKNTFVILWATGPAWEREKTVREQAYWYEHAAFIDPLFERGMIRLGGPFADGSGSLVLVEAADEQEVAETFACDPFVIHGIFARDSLKHIKRWHLFLDADRNPPQ